MPKSKVRKKADAPVRPQSLTAPAKQLAPSPTWYPIVMSVVLVLGLAWLVTLYLDPTNPLTNGLQSWNYLIGCGILLVGLVMAVRWR